MSVPHFLLSYTVAVADIALTLFQQPTETSQSALYGNPTGGGLGSSDIVKNLPKTTGGEGLTRAELAEKKAKEAAEQAEKDK